MTNRKLRRINMDKKKETRTQEISEMIDEGGLGAYKYYDYPKKVSASKEPKSEEVSNMIDEGGLGANLYYNEKTIPNYKE